MLKVSIQLRRPLLAIPLAWALFAVSSESSAAELRREFVSAPLLGSGGAGMTDIFGLDSLFYNPANLARMPNIVGDIVILSPHIEASQNGLSIYKDVQSNKNMLDVVSGSVGRPVSLAVQNATGASFRRTAFALFQRAELGVGVKNNAITGIPTASAQSVVRAGVAFGIGRSFSKNTMHLGITGLIVQKAEAKIEVSALDAQSKLGGAGGKSVLDDALKRGVAVGAHASLMFTPEGSSSPEFVVVARNIGMNYGVGGKSSSERPTSELQTIDVGFSLQPGTKNSRSRISLDVDDVLNTSKENIYKRVHMGAEITFSEIIGVLGGLNQGYTTYGVFINGKIIRIDAGIFAEELGKYPGDTKNRSYYGRVSLGWSK